MQNPIDIALAAYGGKLPKRNKAAVVREHGVKRCSICKEWLWASAFTADAGRVDNLNSKCRNCWKAYLRDWHDRPDNIGKQAEYTRRSRSADPERTAENRLSDKCRAYGITPQRYWEMLEEQGGTCAMCGRTPEQNGKMLAVDHDHACCPTKLKSCGRCVRGLLCSSCNVVLGYIENTAWRARCQSYLGSFKTYDSGDGRASSP